MEFCLHKWFFDYDIVIGWRTLVFHKCAKCGKVKESIKIQILNTFRRDCMLSVYKGKNPNELYLGDDGFLKCKCDVCNEEMNFSDTYCYAKKESI